MSDWDYVDNTASDWDYADNSDSQAITKQAPRFLDRTDRQGGLGVSQDIGEGIYDALANTPEMIEALGKGAGYGAAQLQTNPKRFAQNVGGAVGEYGSQVGNIPAATNKYIESRGLAENPGLLQMPALRLQQLSKLLSAGTPKKPDAMTENENPLQRAWRSIHLPKPGSFDYAQGLADIFGQEREAPRFEEEAEADALAKQLIPSFLAAPGGIPALMGQQLGAEENPFTPLAIPVAQQGIKTGIGAAKQVPKVAKKGAEIVKEPFKKMAEKSNLEKGILESKKGKFDAEQQKNVAQETIEKVMKEHLNEPADISRVNVAKDLAQAGKELRKTGSDMYQEFNNGKWGQKRVFEPIQPEFFDKQYPIPRNALSETTQKLFDKTFGTYAETMKRNPLTGQMEFSVNKQAKAPAVSDYINLQKHLRDEAYSFRKRASAQDKPKGEADILHGYAKALENLRNDIDQKIKGTLPEKQQVKYQGIQNFWKDYVEPFKESSTLSNVSSTHPSVRTNKILESLDKEGYKALKDALLNNEKVAESIGKHDLRSVNIKNPDALGKMLESDLGKTLSPELREGLKANFEILMDNEKTIKALEAKLKKDGLSKSEADKKLSKYKKFLQVGSTSGGLLYALKLLMGVI